MEVSTRASAGDQPRRRMSEKRRSISSHGSSMSKGHHYEHHSTGSISGSGPGNAAKVKMEIETQQARYMKHWEDRNITPLAELYTSGCSVMPPDGAINFGRPGASRATNMLIDSGCDLVKMVTAELEVASNNLAIERGGYKFCKRDKQILETGKYVMVWKRVEGHMKIHMHIWNRNQ